MERSNLNRREFHALAAAAVGGAVAGTIAGCGKTAKTGADGKDGTDAKHAELHLCKGLNTCKAKGKDGKNDCKGQGTCATYKHAAAGKNDCSGQGGCGTEVGTNKCKGQGSCDVPLMKGAWKEAKDAFDKKHGLGKYAKEKVKKTSGA